MRRRVASLPHRLVLVVGAEGRAGHGPRDLPERAALDELADCTVQRAQHLAGRRDQLHAGRLGTLDQVGRFRGGGRHRLVEVDVLPGLDRLQPLLVVEPDRRAEGDRVHGRILEQILVTLVRPRHAEARGRRSRAAGNRVADGSQEDPILDVLEREMRKGAPNPDAAGADDPDPERVGTRSPRIPRPLDDDRAHLARSRRCRR